MKREILTGDAPQLRTRSRTVTEFDEQLADLVADMERAVRHCHGFGLAAPQIGVNLRVITFQVSFGERLAPFMTLVNPVITWASKNTWEHEEQCLSLPGVSVTVERPVRVTVSAQTTTGAAIPEKTYSWETARVIQHEIDHLDGVLITDYEAKNGGNK